VKPQFYLGILLAVAGGYCVARYNPASPAAPKKPATAPAAGALAKPQA